MAYNAVASSKPSIRYEFIQRTYAHVAGAIGAFALISWVLHYNGFGIRALEFISENPVAWLAVLGGFMVLGWISSTFADRADRNIQYVGLGLAVVAEALIFSPLIAYAYYYGGGPETIKSAIYGTGILVVGLTAVVGISRADFSFLRSFLLVGGLLALGFIVTSTLFGYELGTVFSYVMIVFAAGCILYDTDRVLNHYDKEGYVGAALQLFSSVMLVFWYILDIFSSGD